MRELHAERERKPLLPIERGAREPAGASRSTSSRRRTSRACGSSSRRSRRCAQYIDWQFFFYTWELKGKLPGDPRRSPRRRSSSTTRRSCSTRSSATDCCTARGVYGFWPASSDGDDIVVHDDNGTRFCFLRQQSAYGDTRPNRCLADYVAPAGDHVGAFAVTAGIGLEELSARFEADHDDYRSIMAKALADRLAEAFAEYLHEIARREWYETGPAAPPEQLTEESFRGIRPAFGYPACPDHSEKRQALRPARRRASAGISLTESYAMFPGASVSGIYLGHPQARYFSVGRVGRDQVEDYAARKGLPSTRSSAGSGRTSRTSRGVDARAGVPA